MNLNISSDDNWYHFVWQKLPSLLSGDGPFYVGSPNAIQMEALFLAAEMLSRGLQWGHGPGVTAPIPAEEDRAKFLKTLADHCTGIKQFLRPIFLSRQGYSRYGGSIERLCAALGCEVVNLHNLSFREQVLTMRQASLVVSQIGSGLANIPFCREGTQVIELCLDPDQAKIYGNIAALCGCKWERIHL